ncbi:MAG: hypothetical protein KDK04_09570 [Candidatus Competibacteraceae bacterium]|nr:hypothetical protein [Candidatus Competibacteraceae bacterium]
MQHNDDSWPFMIGFIVGLFEATLELAILLIYCWPVLAIIGGCYWLGDILP